MIPGKSADGTPCGMEQCIVNLFWVLFSQRVELLWQGKDNVVVGHREQFALPLHDPPFAVGGLALGAVTVAAAIVEMLLMSAPLTLAGMPAQSAGSAFG